MYFILACSEPGHAQRQRAGCLPRTGELPCSGSGTQRRLERGRLCPAPQRAEGSAGGQGSLAAPPPATCGAREFCHGRNVKHSCWHQAEVAVLPTQKPSHCPSTLHKNPHQLWQPSDYSRTPLSPMEKDAAL